MHIKVLLNSMNTKVILNSISIIRWTICFSNEIDDKISVYEYPDHTLI